MFVITLSSLVEKNESQWESTAFEIGFKIFESQIQIVIYHISHILYKYSNVQHEVNYTTKSDINPLEYFHNCVFSSLNKHCKQ